MKIPTKASALTATALLAGLGIAGTPAHAAEVPDAITSLTTSSTSAGIGDTITLNANWAVPDGSHAGDTFTLPLPPELSPLTTSFPLTNTAGQTVATANVVGGQVVVTLSDYVTTHPRNIAGTLHFSAQINQTAQAGKPITLTWAGQGVVITPHGTGTSPAPTRPDKYGWASANPAGNVGWAIDVPGTVDDAVVTDTPDPGVTLNCSSLYVQVGSTTGGAYPTAWTTIHPATTCTPTGLTLQLGHLDADQMAHILIYSTATGDTSQVTNHYQVTSSAGTTSGSGQAPVYTAGGTGDGAENPTQPTTPTTPAEPTTPAKPTEPSTPATPSTPTDHDPTRGTTPPKETPWTPTPGNPKTETPTPTASTPTHEPASNKPSPTPTSKSPSPVASPSPGAPAPTAAKPAATSPEPTLHPTKSSTTPASPATASASAKPSNAPATTSTDERHPKADQLAYTGAGTWIPWTLGIAGTVIIAGTILIRATRPRNPRK